VAEAKQKWKCPKCKWTGTYKQFIKHFKSKHYKKIKAAKMKTKTAKIPVWAKKK